MEAPSPIDLPHAYVPEPAVEPPEDWPPPTRAVAIEQAHRARLQEGGLPIDQATLERVADAVMDPGYELPGLYRTSEEAGDAITDELRMAVDEYLSRNPGLDGGRRVGWHDGKRTLFVGLTSDAPQHVDALARIGAGRVIVEARSRSVEELDALADRLVNEAEELRVAGYELLVIGSIPDDGVVEVELVGGEDAAAATAFLSSRYGAALRVEWLGPARMRPTPLAFGSWASEAMTLRVFYGLDHNGEEFHSARVAEETADHVLVELTCLKPVGPTTLIGGFQARHVDLELSQPLSDRKVLDASNDQARPSLAELQSR